MNGFEGALLAVDASGTCGPSGVALSVAGRMHVHLLPGSPPRTESLAAVTEALLAEAGVGRGALAGIGAVVGPGSYTGLRSALAFLTGLCLVDGLPAVGVHALDLLAWSGGAEGETVLACAGAGEGRVSLAPLRRLGSDVERLAEPETVVVGALAEAFDRVRDAHGSMPVVLAAPHLSGQVEAAAAAAGSAPRVVSGDVLADLACLSRSRLGRGLASPCASLLPVYAGTSVARSTVSPSGSSGTAASVRPEVGE